MRKEQNDKKEKRMIRKEKNDGIKKIISPFFFFVFFSILSFSSFFDEKGKRMMRREKNDMNGKEW